MSSEGSISGQMQLEQSPKSEEQPAEICRNSVSSRGNSQHKGSEARLCLACPWSNKELEGSRGLGEERL